MHLTNNHSIRLSLAPCPRRAISSIHYAARNLQSHVTCPIARPLIISHYLTPNKAISRLRTRNLFIYIAVDAFTVSCLPCCCCCCCCVLQRPSVDFYRVERPVNASALANLAIGFSGLLLLPGTSWSIRRSDPFFNDNIQQLNLCALSLNRNVRNRRADWSRKWQSIHAMRRPCVTLPAADAATIAGRQWKHRRLIDLSAHEWLSWRH
jgi:hypothetical protein